MTLSTTTVSVMLPVTDPDRSREFYGGRLGLRDDGPDGEGNLRFGAGGCEIVLRQMPAGSQAPHTVLSWEVGDIVQEVADLRSRGVRFEDYDTPELTTVDHVFTGEAVRAAWFLDPDGNVLCLHQPTG